MGVPIFQVDAFTEKPFKGNPAAVCILPGPCSSDWMQNVAKEMNLSETAFLYKQEDGFSLRWFTPAVEVDLCGHATLGERPHLVGGRSVAPPGAARFHTRSGLLTAERRADQIELNFPATPDDPVSIPPGLLEGLGVNPEYVGQSKFDYLVEVDS